MDEDSQKSSVKSANTVSPITKKEKQKANSPIRKIYAFENIETDPKDAQNSSMDSETRDSNDAQYSSTNTTVDTSPSEGVSSPISPIAKNENNRAISPIMRICTFANTDG